MQYIEHMIEPDRLLLTWQAANSQDRSRFVVGEILRNDHTVSLKYYFDSPDFQQALQYNFTGYPSFPCNVQEYDNQVMASFMPRLPPRNRRDFSRYLELRGLNPELEVSDFALLGYSGARLPNDGFELVHPFDQVDHPFEIIVEIAGFRHCSVVGPEHLSIGDAIHFCPEPDNTSDPEAIRIDLAETGEKLGYVDRGRCDILHRYLESGFTITGEIYRKNGSQDRPLIYLYTRFSPA